MFTLKHFLSFDPDNLQKSLDLNKKAWFQPVLWIACLMTLVIVPSQADLECDTKMCQWTDYFFKYVLFHPCTTVIIKQAHCKVKVNEACQSMVEMNVATGKGSLVLTVNLLLLQKNYSCLDQPYEKIYLQSWCLNLPAFLVLYLDLEESRCLVKANMLQGWNNFDCDCL